MPLNSFGFSNGPETLKTKHIKNTKNLELIQKVNQNEIKEKKRNGKIGILTKLGLTPK